MRLEIPIQEVQEFLSNYYQLDIDLKNIATDKIQATYIDSLVLILKGFNKDEILFNYESDGLVNLAAKITHYFLERKLEEFPIEWNPGTREIIIKLRSIPALNEFQRHIEISKLHFTEDKILLLMFARDKNKIT